MKLCAGIVVAIALGWVVAVQAVQTPSTVIFGPSWVMSVTDGDTITVRLPNGEPLKVRYLGINAPELSDEEHSGQAAKDANSASVKNRNVWLEVERTNGDFRRGRDRRVLAHVFSDAERTQLVQQALVEKGLALIDLPGLTDWEIAADDFPIRHADQLIAAQIEAAQNRRGVWNLDDFYPDADLAIAAIKFWGEKEAVYLINRGSEPLELADGWVLMDASAGKSKKEGRNPAHVLSFAEFFGPSCVLPPGGKLIIYSGAGIPPEMRGRITGCGTGKVEVYWTRRKVWDNDGDTAYLLGPDGKLYFIYSYPPFRER